MSDLLEQAFARIRTLPPDAQDEVARLLLDLAGGEVEPYRLTPEESASLAPSRAQAARREFASPETVRAIWDKHAL